MLLAAGSDTKEEYVGIVRLAYVNDVVFNLLFICVCMLEFTPSRYPIYVEETFPIDVVDGRVTTPVKIGEAIDA